MLKNASPLIKTILTALAVAIVYDFFLRNWVAQILPVKRS